MLVGARTPVGPLPDRRKSAYGALVNVLRNDECRSCDARPECRDQLQAEQRLPAGNDDARFRQHCCFSAPETPPRIENRTALARPGSAAWIRRVRSSAGFRFPCKMNLWPDTVFQFVARA